MYLHVSDRTLKALSPVHRRELDEILQRHYATIYHGEDEIPPERWALNPSDATRIGLKNGWVLGWMVLGTGPFWFTAESRYWIGNEGAGSKVETFVWLFLTWVRVRTTLGPVS